MPELEIPTRYRLRVKQRLAVVTYAEVHGVKPAGRHFGLDRKTVRDWRDRYRALGLAGLLPRYPTRRRRRVSPRVVELAAQARQEHRFGFRPLPILPQGSVGNLSSPAAVRVLTVDARAPWAQDRPNHLTRCARGEPPAANAGVADASPTGNFDRNQREVFDGD